MGTKHWECRGGGLGGRRSELPQRELFFSGLLEVFYGSTSSRSIDAVHQNLMRGSTLIDDG